MSLSNYATSRDRGQPVEIYEFVYGDGTGDAFRYTDGEREVVVDSQTFTPLAITRNESIQSKGRPKNTSLSITLPSSAGLVGLFRGTPPRRVVFVRIYEGVIPNDDDPGLWTADLAFGLRWSGRILEAKRQKKGTTVLSCDTLGAGMKRPGLTVFYQRPCQKQLYGAYCNANKVAATSTVTLDGVSGEVLTVPTGWEGANDINSYIGGLVEWTGAYGTESRMIIEPGPTTIYLDSPAYGLAALDDVSVILGCPHTLAACTDLHNNVNNYGGFPWIPRSNPINKNNHT